MCWLTNRPGHHPNRIEVELHTDPDNLGRSTGFSIPLYRDGKSAWRQGLNTAGEIDVAVIEIERSALPEPVANFWVIQRVEPVVTGPRKSGS